MILTLTASIMYWSLQQQAGESETGESSDLDASPVSSVNGENDKILASERSPTCLSMMLLQMSHLPHNLERMNLCKRFTEPSPNSENGVTIEGSPSPENEKASSHVDGGGHDTE
ncbi:hypothetical protein NL676_000619 [Syzygium grande]|nr:hypothetical protein NL676_000619 [Syzygium grande]